MVVATAHNRIIGKDNQMPWHMPADLKYFKKVTLNKPIIMGRKTFESIGRPLPGRRNVVISRDKNYHHEGIEVVSSVEAALALVQDVEEIMVIGGGAIYAHCLPKAQRLYITHIDLETGGDTQFPDYEKEAEWSLVSTENHTSDDKNPHPYSFNVYERVG